jgi:hypothetical protein
MRIFRLVVLVLFLGCSSDPAPKPGVVQMSPSLGSSRFFFGHQSVGRDVIAGLQEISPGLRVMQMNQVDSTVSGALLESNLGHNGNPASKDEAFLEAIAGLGPGDVAFYKYCYVDMSPNTEPAALFARYSATLDSADRTGIHTIAMTMPITSLAPAWKRWVKRGLGRVTELELNSKRQLFNDMVRDRYEAHVLIDIARLESTLEDGTRIAASVEGRSIEVLPSDYTDDGAHLNERGRRHVARGFIATVTGVVDALQDN